MAQVALAQGNLTRAAQLLAESLPLALRAGRKESIVTCMAAAGEAALAAEEPALAAKLLAFSESMLQSLDLHMFAMERTVFERSLALLRAKLDETTFASAWAEGCTLSLEQAVASAQQVLRSISGEYQQA